MKRTKRYGGFRIGDRVKTKHDYNIGEGEVVGMRDGYLLVKFIVLGNGVVDFAFMPNQLINLTRIEEEKITDPLPLMREETAKEIEERFIAFCNKNKITPPKANFNPAKEIDELKAIRGFVAEALRQTEIFLSPLTPCGSPLPSPYTRDVYTTTKDY